MRCTTAFKSCQDSLKHCLSPSYWTYAASVTSLSGQRLSDHVDISTSVKKPPNSLMKRLMFCRCKKLQSQGGLDQTVTWDVPQSYGREVEKWTTIGALVGGAKLGNNLYYYVKCWSGYEPLWKNSSGTMSRSVIQERHLPELKTRPVISCPTAMHGFVQI